MPAHSRRVVSAYPLTHMIGTRQAIPSMFIFVYRSCDRYRAAVRAKKEANRLEEEIEGKLEEIGDEAANHSVLQIQRVYRGMTGRKAFALREDGHIFYFYHMNTLSTIKSISVRAS